MHFGIDYGSKLAGTTVISWEDNGRLCQRSSTKNQNADRYIIDTLKEKMPSAIYIDAPLSLPAAFYNKGLDFFYREADKQLKAMSPMFLGGLTARAMSLSHLISEFSIPVFEVYPSALVREILDLKSTYIKKDKSKIRAFLTAFKEKENLEIEFDTYSNWHEVDSMLAWYSGYRHKHSCNSVYGNEEEGVIIV